MGTLCPTQKNFPSTMKRDLDVFIQNGQTLEIFYMRTGLKNGFRKYR